MWAVIQSLQLVCPTFCWHVMFPCFHGNRLYGRVSTHVTRCSHKSCAEVKNMWDLLRVESCWNLTRSKNRTLRIKYQTGLRSFELIQGLICMPSYLNIEKHLFMTCFGSGLPGQSSLYGLLMVCWWLNAVLLIYLSILIIFVRWGSNIKLVYFLFINLAPCVSNKATY